MSKVEPAMISLNSNKYSNYIKRLAMEEIKQVLFRNSEINTAIGLLLHKVEKSTIEDITKEYVKNVSYIHRLEDICISNNLYNADKDTFLLLMHNKLNELQRNLNQLKSSKTSKKQIVEAEKRIDTIHSITLNFKKGHTF